MSGPEKLEWFVALKLAAGAKISAAMVALKILKSARGVKATSRLSQLFYSICVWNS